jgi:hypothetical protein
MGKLNVSIFFFALVTGCSAVPTNNGATPSQSRALQWGAGNPFCLIFCFATATATDAEGAGSARSGNSSQSGSVSVGTPSIPSGVKE